MAVSIGCVAVAIGTLHPAPSTKHPALCTMHEAPSTMRPALCTVNCALCTDPMNTSPESAHCTPRGCGKRAQSVVGGGVAGVGVV